MLSSPDCIAMIAMFGWEGVKESKRLRCDNAVGLKVGDEIRKAQANVAVKYNGAGGVTLVGR